ncbi:endo-1,3(4)-beta-glucanase-like protein [Fragilariopsis cylindrus CCMP1102]|uniref:Endo-1,3(4)-beta-glucanase-like protein n=1 Tax=Fragilariopsis cylindrus CCMP1102 TaxID=635003 RepID=A0A1E7F9Y6_9STRA|nr:endo-1,3(4)-beta-glucanase-like protein [Fragilariopsis cylindrus CCMP1102]|eukprot:OEU14978.1 endo-1,3(4)-beta-glucanase-like protein [Fragilariopsis cylindrus CCMP1102]
MPPKESDALLSGDNNDQQRRRNKFGKHLSLDDEKLRSKIHTIATTIAESTESSTTSTTAASDADDETGSGSYKLIEKHQGKSFFDYYIFNDGPDSIGSNGYNTYVSKTKAEELNLIHVDDDNENSKNEEGNNNGNKEDSNNGAVYISSSKGTNENDRNPTTGTIYRNSVRLEGKRRFDNGLIILDVDQMPTGCGVWPAFWTTDETNWPDHGEIDIVEPINNQNIVKTALHTNEYCDMYSHVPRWNWTGSWDVATGIPDTYTGKLNFNNKLESDNCDVMTPHQWANQGCVAISDKNNTLGHGMNQNGGGIYVLEWDPIGGYIKSWVFPRTDDIPINLQQSLLNTNNNDDDDDDETTIIDPSSWSILPYAYFAIGNNSGCSANHFQNHRIVINLAFCGTVAGNRFATDCPVLYKKYNKLTGYRNSSVAACNAYIDSNEVQEVLNNDAYWKINGVYLYQRE